MDYKKGDKVETVYGEKLDVLAVKTVLTKKSGQPTGETTDMVLAKSGDYNVWFPVTNLKKKGK